MPLSLAHRLNNISREVISNVSCADTNCTCDWSMKVGTITRHNSTVRPKSSVKLARLILWHYAVSNETILALSREVQGNNYFPFCTKEILIFDSPMQSLFTSTYGLKALTFGHKMNRLLSLPLPVILHLGNKTSCKKLLKSLF